MSIPALKDSISNDNEYYLFVNSPMQKSIINYFINGKQLNFIIKSKSKFLFYLKLFSTRFNNFYFVHGNRGYLKDLILYFLRSKCKIIPKSNSNYLNSSKYIYISNENLHKVNYYRSFFHLDLINEYPIRFNFNQKKNSRINILISPGSGDLEKHKRWKISEWNKLIFKLNKENKFNIHIIYTENEKCIYDNLDKKLDIIPFKPNSIIETMDYIKEIDFAISVCNGTSHICSIMGKPVFAMYGPTNPFYTGVFGKKHYIFRKLHSCNHNSFKIPPYYCLGCYSNNIDYNDPICMNGIDEKEVYTQLTNFISYSFNLNLSNSKGQISIKNKND